MRCTVCVGDQGGRGSLLLRVPLSAFFIAHFAGAFTIVIGALSYWIIVDFPDDATFLTPEEKQIVKRRLEADGQHGARAENFTWSAFWASFRDWKTYTGAVIYMGVDGALYAFSLFLPSIIKQINNYTPTVVQLMSVPPYAFACVLVSPLYSTSDILDRYCGVFCR
jgi:hypothetical protein